MTKMLKALQVIFGYDFGYFRYKSFRLKCFVQFIFFLRCLILCSIILINTYDKTSNTISWFCGNLYAVKHFIYMLIFAFIQSDYTFCKFENEIRVIDTFMKCENSFWFVEKRKAVFYLVHYLYRIFVSVYYFFSSKISLEDVYLATIYTFLGLSYDTILVSVSVLFYSVYHRFIIFESYLKSDCCDLVSFHHLYKALADIIDKFHSIYEHVVCSFFYYC